MLPFQSDSYIEDLFYSYPSRIYRLKVCRERMAYRHSGTVCLGAKNSYREYGLPPDLLQLVIQLEAKIKETVSVYKGLKEEEKRFVAYRYFDDMAMGEVSGRMHISRSGLYDMRKRILSKAARILVIASPNFEGGEQRDELLAR